MDQPGAPRDAARRLDEHVAEAPRAVGPGAEVRAAEQLGRHLAGGEGGLGASRQGHGAQPLTATSGKSSMPRGVSCWLSVSLAPRSSPSARRCSISARYALSVSGRQNSAASLATRAAAKKAGKAASSVRKT